MNATTKGTKAKTREPEKQRKKPGPKPTGKVYASYFLTPELIEMVSKQEQPSIWVEKTLRRALKMKNV